MYKKILVLLVILFSLGALASCTDDLTTNPITETPTTSVPTTDAPATEAPTTDAPTTEAPTTEAPTTETPTTEAPTTEVPTTEAPTTEVPTTEVPTTEAPTTEAPTTDAPTTDAPTTEVPTTEDDNYYDDYIDLSEVHSKADGTSLTVSGVVYYLTQNGYYIQDNTGNLFIFTDKAVPTVELGDRVVVQGSIGTYRQVKQIKEPTLIETNAYDLDIDQPVLAFEFGVTNVQPGMIYQITGEVRIEGDKNTVFLYNGNTKIAELYYMSLTASIGAVETYAGDIITVNFLYYAMGDNVERYAFQGTQADISVEILDESIAIQEDANTIQTEQILFGNFDFGDGYYGSVFTITSVTGAANAFVNFNGSVLTVTKPTEEEGDALGTVTILVTLNDQTPITKTVNITVKAAGSSTIDMTYYQNAEGLSGQTLLLALNSIINNGFKQLSYDDAKWVLEESDRDPENSKNIILVYLRTSITGKWNYPAWNREHTWPQSKLNASGQKADMHNLKPADVDENSRRGNKPFSLAGQGGYEPHDEVKGDVARILFYMATMYTSLNIESGVVGNMETLLQWNLMDPVDDFERTRNEVIFSHQKNRNPFIDYPDFADLIWG